MKLIEKIKYIKFSEIPTQYFFNIKMCYYINIFTYYKKNIEQIYSSTYMHGDFNDMQTKLSVCDDKILYIFDELSYAHLLNIYCVNIGHRDFLKKFFTTSKYICFFCEIFEDINTLKTIGNNTFNIDFALLFFKNANKVILCNNNNIDILKKYDIFYNIIYFPPIGYSEINNLVPLITNVNKKIDILFYGSIYDEIIYRNNILKEIKEFSIFYNYNFEIYNNLHNEEKNKKLIDTKIVIHIPSYSNLNTVPWAKISELMCKKIFFIIEYNEEIYKSSMKEFIPTYDPYIKNDLINKIKYFLCNENVMVEYVDKCYNYIRYNYDMDKFIGDILY